MPTAPPTTPLLPLTWGQPPFGDTVDRRTRVWADTHLRQRWGIGSRWAQIRVMGVASVVLAVWAPREGLLCVAGLVTVWCWLTRGQPFVTARRLRASEVADVRMTARLDDEGAHETGPDLDLHHRWHEFDRARLREGFLVLVKRERPGFEVLCLDLLGPGVDRRDLLAEVRRRIAEGATPEGGRGRRRRGGR